MKRECMCKCKCEKQHVCTMFEFTLQYLLSRRPLDGMLTAFFLLLIIDITKKIFCSLWLCVRVFVEVDISVGKWMFRKTQHGEHFQVNKFHFTLHSAFKWKMLSLKRNHIAHSITRAPFGSSIHIQFFSSHITYFYRIQSFVHTHRERERHRHHFNSSSIRMLDEHMRAQKRACLHTYFSRSLYLSVSSLGCGDIY